VRTAMKASITSPLTVPLGTPTVMLLVAAPGALVATPRSVIELATGVGLALGLGVAVEVAVFVAVAVLVGVGLALAA
jgi:hypothetical protein